MSDWAPPGWYPDPSRTHEVRWFDGNTWTDHVGDQGVSSSAPLGPLPPGMVAWYPPSVMVHSAMAAPNYVEVPRAKMWIFAVLSAFSFRIGTPDFVIVLPVGIVFAILCWRITAEPLKAHEQVSTGSAPEITAARWVAVGLALVSVAQFAVWSHL